MDIFDERMIQHHWVVILKSLTCFNTGEQQSFRCKTHLTFVSQSKHWQAVKIVIPQLLSSKSNKAFGKSLFKKLCATWCYIPGVIAIVWLRQPWVQMLTPMSPYHVTPGKQLASEKITCHLGKGFQGWLEHPHCSEAEWCCMCAEPRVCGNACLWPQQQLLELQHPIGGPCQRVAGKGELWCEEPCHHSMEGLIGFEQRAHQ